MGMNYQYVEMDRIFSKLIRDVTSDFNERDVVEWTGEALEFIGAVGYYEEAIHFSEVKDHQCTIPSGTHAIIQVARNHCWTRDNSNAICPSNLIKELPESEEVFTLFTTSQHGMVLNDEEIPYYKSFFDLKCSFNTWCGSSFSRGCYSPVRLSTNTLFNTIVCKDSSNMGCSDCREDEYTIIRGRIIRFSFREGHVAIPYLKQVTSPDTGYPMIPDNISYTTAIVKYIALKMAEKDLDSNRDGAAGKVDRYSRDWQWYCKQAGNVDKMPYGIDDHQDLLDQRSYLLPRQNRYYGFFGNLNKPENRKYNDPDMRNWSGRYF